LGIVQNLTVSTLKKIAAFAFASLLYFNSWSQVGINILIPDSSAALQIESNNKGLGLPRLTTTQRDAIYNPLRGLTIFNTQDSLIEYWNGECWLKAYEKNCYECNFLMTIDDPTDTLDRVQDDSVFSTITITQTNGNQDINVIYLASLPQGVSVHFNGNTTVDSTGTLQIVVKADQCATVGGNFPIIIQAFCGDQIRFLAYNVYIRPPVQITLPTDQTDYNLQAQNSTLLPAGSQSYVVLTINGSVELKSSSITTPAFTTGNLAPNSLVCILNNGAVLGRGGNGGSFAFGGNLLIAGGDPGLAGGNAMNLTTRTVLINNGAVFGGGSGGGSVGFALGTPSIPIVGSFVIGFGFCGGGGSELGLGGVTNQGGITVGLFESADDATCCLNSIPGAGPQNNFPISIPISVATVEITPTAFGGNGGAYGQQGTRGYIDVTLRVGVSIPIVGTIWIPIPIPGGFLPFYGPFSPGPGLAIKRNNNPLTGVNDGTYNTAQIKGVVTQ
jgi:hypothetical protein